MELRHLRAFIAVAEELHFSRAAVRLNMAQPPLSRQIQRLEEELGVVLLRRTQRHVELTEPGRAFLTSAREILAQVETAVARTRRWARGEEGHIAIGVVSSVAFGERLPRVLRRFRERHPAVSVSLQEMSAEAQMSALREGQIHLGFMRPPALVQGMAVTPFFREPLVAVLPAEHPLAGRTRLPLRALAGDPFITVPRGQALGGLDLVVEACRQAGFSPNVSQNAQELQSVIGYVASGFGVSLLPQTARKLLHADVAFVSLSSPRVFVEVSAVHSARSESPLLAAFLAVLRETAGQDQPPAPSKR